MLVGSMANGLCASGGFCAGSKVVVDHQRINGTSFVFSAAMPALLAVSASMAIGILTDQPSIFEALRENVQTVRSTLHGVEGIEILSHPVSAIIHIALKPCTAPSHLLLAPMQTSSSGRSNPASVISAKDAVTFDWRAEEKILQEVVDEALNAGVLITRAKKLRGQELVEVRPTIRLAITSALTKKETEKATAAVKSAFVKVLSRRR
jgi:serine palmitoyltransferase